MSEVKMDDNLGEHGLSRYEMRHGGKTTLFGSIYVLILVTK